MATGAAWTGAGRAARRCLAGLALRCAAFSAVEEAATFGFGSALGQLELAADLLLGDRALARGRVGLGDGAEVAVGEGVAEGVAQADPAAVGAVLAEAGDAAVVDRDDGGALLGEDVDVVALDVALDGDGDVALLDALGLGVDLAGVAGGGVDGEARLREAGEGADEVGRQAADGAGAQQHGVDVPVGVVVGEDAAAQVLLGARGLEVARGGEDRVHRVEGVLDAVLVGVDAVHLPRRGHELHPAQRAGAGDVEVAPVVGLDLVDRREDLPADAVLRARRLVDREAGRAGCGTCR